MRRGYRNLLIFAAVAIIGYLLATFLTSSISTGEDELSPPPSDPSSVGSEAIVPSSSASPTPDEMGEEKSAEAGAGRRSYAISMFELPGLPPDAKPGLKLEIWASWKPPMTHGPKVQRLLSGAVLEKVSPSLTPEGPPVAILSVAKDDVADLLFGDRFGSLSVAIVP